ncbi:MAG: hypothetical protein AAFO07_31195 [Bacteroidota bacterium]
MSTIAIILFLLIPDAQQIEDNKYLTALLYLKTNTEISGKVKKYFKRNLKGSEINCGLLKFNVSNNIYFQSVSNFQDKIDYDKLAIDPEVLNNQLKDEAINGFNSFQSSFISQLIPQNSSRLHLAFSKPVGNYLLAEFYFRNNSDKETPFPLNAKVKRGTFVHLLFYFDENNTVSEVYVSSFHYN